VFNVPCVWNNIPVIYCILVLESMVTEEGFLNSRFPNILGPFIVVGYYHKNLPPLHQIYITCIKIGPIAIYLQY
jgi:hypothetical protein